MKFTLSLTHNCNLACPYCYAGDKVDKVMSRETAEAIIDFAYTVSPSGTPIELSFFGGEPLLAFARMRETIDYARRHPASASNPLELSITSNGTLLSDEVLDYLRQEDIGLCVSLDGDEEQHNQSRPYKSGKGSYGKVVANLKRALEQRLRVQLNCVFGREEIGRLDHILDSLLATGASIIHLNPNISENWDTAAINALDLSYRRLAERYIQHFKDGREIAVNLLDSKMLLFLKQGYADDDRCGMGEREWGFAPSGNIYPCERFIGDDDNQELCMGNVHNGLSGASRCEIAARRGNNNSGCVQCPLQKYCMNSCGCTNYFMTGDTTLASEFLCANEKAAIGAAKHIFDTLGGEPGFIDHLLRYFSNTPSATIKEKSYERTHIVQG